MTTFQYSPAHMPFTELLTQWLKLENQRGMDREESERHWQLGDELNRRCPSEDFT